MPGSAVSPMDAGASPIPRSARRPGRGRRVSALALTIALALGLVQLGAPLDVAAANGYTLTSSTSYVVNPEAGRLDVTVTFQFRNNTPNQGNTSYYYDFLDFPAEDSATSLKAVADAGTATVSRAAREDGDFDRYRVRFSAEINFGQTRRLTISYRVPSGAPRSDSPVRVNQAQVSFCTIANGVDSGSLTISVPDRFAAAGPAKGQVTLIITGLPEPVQASWDAGGD